MKAKVSRNRRKKTALLICSLQGPLRDLQSLFLKAQSSVSLLQHFTSGLKLLCLSLHISGAGRGERHCVFNDWYAEKNGTPGAGPGLRDTQNNTMALSRLADTSEPFITNNGKFVAEDTGCFFIALDTFTHTLS